MLHTTLGLEAQPPSAGSLIQAPEQCQVLGDTFGFVVQGLLFGVCLGTLLCKWWFLDKPRRRFQIFLLDSSKQIFGAGLIHVLNMACAIIFSNLESATADQCAWYWVNIMIDTTLGVAFCWALLRVSEKYFGYDSGHYGKSASGAAQISASGNLTRKTGMDWEHDPDYGKWFSQIVVWGVIVSMMKLIVVILMFLFASFWESVAIFCTHWIEDRNRRLIFVMIITPTCMNIFQFCVTDMFLKFQRKSDGEDGKAVLAHEKDELKEVVQSMNRDREIFGVVPPRCCC